MKAIICDEYGSIEQLRYCEFDLPALSEGQLRIENCTVGGELLRCIADSRPLSGPAGNSICARW